MPIWHAGKRTGFEFDISPLNRSELDGICSLEVIGARDVVCSFRFSRADELAIAMPSALVLTLISEGVFHDPQEDETLWLPEDLSNRLQAYDPKFWQNQQPLIEPDRERFPILPEQWQQAVPILKNLLDDYVARITKLPTGFEKLIIEGVPVPEIMVLPPAIISEMLKSGPSMIQLVTIGRAMRAIDTLKGRLPGSLDERLARLRHLCAQTIQFCGLKEIKAQ